MNNNSDPTEYDIRQEGSGWTVYNTKTGKPVRLNDAAQVGLSREVATEILRMLREFQPGRDVSQEG
ncbi:hypothetical protein [Methylobacterium longum]|uniref:Uncharacterized protein n=1 Tax=Methylobacterium longum TaxID=767694 RepID=A0ABT8B0R8_9HYPH|nr:hypothetical protein [Methylobacterium longum]MDN3575113.1 hypothetical protein [Methylobacterium longum]GJE15225.1 hypothetical protein FOHLNKBM_6303 [Methylobacterium longum]